MDVQTPPDGADRGQTTLGERLADLRRRQEALRAVVDALPAEPDAEPDAERVAVAVRAANQLAAAERAVVSQVAADQVAPFSRVIRVVCAAACAATATLAVLTAVGVASLWWLVAVAVLALAAVGFLVAERRAGYSGRRYRRAGAVILTIAAAGVLVQAVVAWAWWSLLGTGMAVVVAVAVHGSGPKDERVDLGGDAA
jgi:hypothetical protein